MMPLIQHTLDCLFSVVDFARPVIGFDKGSDACELIQRCV